MSFHILGAGAIGSLLATQLRQTFPASAITFLLRSGQTAAEWHQYSDQQKGSNDATTFSSSYYDRSASLSLPTAAIELVDETLEPKLQIAGQSQSDIEQLQRQAEKGTKSTGGTKVDNFQLQWVTRKATNQERRRYVSTNIEARHQRSSRDLFAAAAGPISTLFVCCKASSILPGLDLLRARLTPESTIVILSEGMGIVEDVIAKYFLNRRTRPTFVVGLWTHQAQRSWVKKTIPRITWQYQGQLQMAVLPSSLVTDTLLSPALRSRYTKSNPLLNIYSESAPPSVEEHLPLVPATESLRTAMSSVLACTSLNPQWTTFSEFYTSQKQQIAAQTILYLNTAVLSVLYGQILKSWNRNPIMHAVAKEISAIYFAQAEREEDDTIFGLSEFPQRHPLSTNSILAALRQIIYALPSGVSPTLINIQEAAQHSDQKFMADYLIRLGSTYNVPTPQLETMLTLVEVKLSIEKDRTATLSGGQGRMF